MAQNFYCSKCKKQFSHSNTDMYVVEGKQLCPDCKGKIGVKK